MKLRCSPSVRSRLILLVLACIVPAVLAAIALIHDDYRRARDQLLADSVLTARAMAIVVDKEFAIVESSLHTLATSASLATNDLPAIYVQAQTVARQYEVLNIVLSDGDGRQSFNTLLPYGAALPQTTLLAPLKAVSVTRRPGISNLFLGPVSNRPVIAIGVPITRGQATDVLSASISIERMRKLLIEQHLPHDWIVAILDKNNTIVARTHEMEQYVGKRSRLSLSGHMAIADEGAFEGTTLDGTPVFGIFSRAPNTRWTVAIGIPRASLNRDVDRRLSWLVAGTIALLSLSLVLAWFIGGHIARSVRGLARRPMHSARDGWSTSNRPICARPTRCRWRWRRPRTGCAKPNTRPTTTR